MKKNILITIISLLACASLALFASGSYDKAQKKSYSKEDYTIKKHHEKLRFDCADCHGDGPKESYTELSTKDCLECHKDYQTLAERTEHLGYDDNIHASPHYPKMDCNLCHSSHKESTNYCLLCHSQDSMKKILVP